MKNDRTEKLVESSIPESGKKSEAIPVSVFPFKDPLNSTSSNEDKVEKE